MKNRETVAGNQEKIRERGQPLSPVELDPEMTQMLELGDKARDICSINGLGLKGKNGHDE